MSASDNFSSLLGLKVCRCLLRRHGHPYLFLALRDGVLTIGEMKQLQGMRNRFYGLLLANLLLLALLQSTESASELPAALKGRREGSYHMVHRDGSSKERVFLVAAITSPAAWPDRRNLLRKQWVKNVDLLHHQVSQEHVHAPKLVHKFVIGTGGISSEELDGILQEDIMHEDILLLPGLSDLEVDYSYLHPHWPWYNTSATAEKVLYSIQWAVKLYDFQYFARVGDDAYFRVDEFYRQAMAKPLPTAMSLFGQMIGPLSYPVAGKENSIVYPSGAGYIITQDVASFISASAGMLNAGFPEDTNFGAWLAGTKVVFHDMGDRFHDLVAGQGYYQPCNSQDILVHRFRTEEDWKKVDAAGLVQC